MSMTLPGRPASELSLPMTNRPTRSAITGTAGPRDLAFNFPEISRIQSRTISASRRRNLPEPNKVLSGSTRFLSAWLVTACRQARDCRISRCRCFKLQPLSMNSTASQSNSSGCEGAIPWTPKSPGVSTSPRPKCCRQTRLTMTREVSG